MNLSTPLALFNGSFLSSKPTGIGVVARDLVKALDPNLVSLIDPLGGTRLGSIPIPNLFTPEFGLKGHIRRLVWTQTQLPEILRNSGADLLLSPLPEAPLFRGVRSVVIVHDLLPLRYPQLTPLLAYHVAYVPMVLHRAVKVLCNSNATAREVHRRLAVPTRKLITIPLGVNSEELCPLGIERKNFFLVLGRHDPHKNIPVILRAFARLQKKDIELKLVGPQDRRYTPHLKSLAKELGISEYCSWIPWVTEQEKLKLLNSCQALVIASYWEGFGLPPLEAMACNTPVIASTGGALPEVVADAGILFDPKDIHALTDAMKQVLHDSSLRTTLISRGASQLKKYSWARSARLVEGVLAELCI